jgi:hypothetical protein
VLRKVLSGMVDEAGNARDGQVEWTFVICPGLESVFRCEAAVASGRTELLLL